MSLCFSGRRDREEEQLMQEKVVIGILETYQIVKKKKLEIRGDLI